MMGERELRAPSWMANNGALAAILGEPGTPTPLQARYALEDAR